MGEITIDSKKINTIMKQFGETFSVDNNILKISKGAVKHIKKKHPADWEKYADKLQQIISEADYIGKNPKEKNDIEFYKKFLDSDTNEVVFVAVRLLEQTDEFSGQLTLSTLYVLDNHEKKIEGRLNTHRIMKYE